MTHVTPPRAAADTIDPRGLERDPDVRLGKWLPVQDSSLPYGTADAVLEGFFGAHVLYLSPADFARIRHGHESIERQFHHLKWAIERRINRAGREALERIGENEL